MLTENVSTLKIHKLTQEQYDRELAAGNIDDNALYLTPDEEIDLTPYATKDDLSKKADTGHTHDDRYYTEAEVDAKLDAKQPKEATSFIMNNDGGYVSVKTPDRKTGQHYEFWDNDAGWADIKAGAITANGGFVGNLTGNASTATSATKATQDASGNTITSTYATKTELNTAKSNLQTSIDGKSDKTHTHTVVNGVTPVYSTIENGDSSYLAAWSLDGKNIKAVSKSDTTVGYAISASSASKATQDGSGNTITSTYETKTDSSSKLATAKAYADNAATTAANKVKNDLLNGAGGAYDTLKELGDLIDDNTDAIDALEAVAANKADKSHTHDDRYYTESEIDTKLSGKANTSHGNHVPATQTANNAVFLRNDNTWATVTPANIGAAASSHGTHVSYSTTAPVMDGTASVGSASTVARSDHKHPTDTSRAAQSALDALTTTVSGKANKSHTHAISDVTNLQSSLDGKSNTGHTHNYAGSSSAGGAATSANKVNSSMVVKLNGGTTEGTNMFTFNGSAAKTVNITPSGIGAAASSHTHDDRYYTESEVDTKLSGKSNTNHTHNYAGSSSAGGSANSAIKLATARTISLTGDVTGSTSFDGSGNASITATVADDSHNHVISNVDGLQTALDGRVLKRKATGDAYNSLGTYYGGGSTAKYVRISFPSVPTWTMMSMELTVREDYNSAKYGKLMIYANQFPSAEWNEFFAVYHDTLSSNIKVYASDKKHIYIGGLAAYGGVSLDRMLIGDSAMSSDLTNMTITGVDSLPTTYQTATMKRSFVEGDTLTGNLSGNASTATNVAWSGVTSKPSYYDAKAIKGITRSGTTFTYTCMDGTTGTFTQQDNNTTYSAATQSAQGLMSAADKKKLDGIATGANAYSLPTASSSTLGGVKTTSTVTSTSGLTACPIISGVPYYKDTNTTYSLSSFGITATAAELNYTDGVTSNIQTQLNGKAASSHTHSYLPLSGGTVTGATTFNSTVKIGNATLTYDSTNKRMVISVA